MTSRNFLHPLPTPAVFVLLAFVAFVNAAPPPILPVEPMKLLEALPDAPEGWKLTRSTAKTDISVLGNSVTTAVRSFTIPPVVEGGPEIRLTIKAMDSAAQTSTVQDFESRIRRSENGEGGGTPVVLSETISGIIKLRSDTQMRFEGMVGNRLVLQIDASPVDAREFEALLKLLNFSKLKIASARLPQMRSRSKTFQVRTVDELNPVANRSRVVTLYDPDEDAKSNSPE